MVQSNGGITHDSYIDKINIELDFETRMTLAIIYIKIKYYYCS
jgi:hypothetical protein